MEKLRNFIIDGVELGTEYVETQQVKEGVECDIYRFTNNSSRDLAIVRVSKGYKTPLQRIVKGDKTTEGFISGAGTLSVIGLNGSQGEYNFPNSSINEIDVTVGDTMQWSASENLTFFELCTPPYKDGRFEDLD